MTAGPPAPLPFDPVGAWSLAIGMWLLGMDSAMVIGLRTLKIVAGGADAEQETQDMITEKFMAAFELPLKLVDCGVMSPAAMTHLTLNHYSNKVSANRKRLSRGEPT